MVDADQSLVSDYTDRSYLDGDPVALTVESAALNRADPIEHSAAFGPGDSPITSGVGVDTAILAASLDGYSPSCTPPTTVPLPPSLTLLVLGAGTLALLTGRSVPSSLGPLSRRRDLTQRQ